MNKIAVNLVFISIMIVGGLLALVIPLASAVTVTTFNNSLSEENMTFDGSSDVIRYLDINLSVFSFSTTANFRVNSWFDAVTLVNQSHWSSGGVSGNQEANTSGVLYTVNQEEYFLQNFRIELDTTTNCPSSIEVCGVWDEINTGGAGRLATGTYDTTPFVDGSSEYWECNLTTPLNLTNTEDYLLAFNTTYPVANCPALIYEDNNDLGGYLTYYCDGQDNTGCGAAFGGADMGLRIYQADYVKNFSLEVGTIDGSPEYNYTGFFNSTNVLINLLSSAINNFISSCVLDNGICHIPFTFSSINAGIIEYFNISVDNHDFVENSQVFNATVPESSSENFNINISFDPLYYSSAEATLVYDGTSYVGTKTGTGSNLLFDRSLTVPLVSSNEDKEFYWQLAMTNSSGTTIINSSFNNQTVLDSGISDSGTTIAINYTIYHEETLAVIAANLDVTFDWFFGDASVSENASFSKSGASQYLFYIDPNNITYTVDSELKVYNQPTNLLGREFNFNNEIFSNASQIDRALYLPNETLTKSVIIEFVDEGLQPLADHYIEIARFYPGDGAYRIVENRQTNSFGQIPARLIEGDVRYRFRFYDDDGTLLKTENNVIIACEATICIISFINQDETDDFQRFNDIDDYSHSFSFNNNTNIFTFSWTDSRSTTGTNRILVQRTLINGTVEVCDDSSSLVVGSLTCAVGDSKASYRAQVFTTVDGDERRLDVLNVKVGSLYGTFGLDGLIWSFFLLFTLVAVGLFSPAVAIILYLTALVALTFLDIVALSPIVIIANLVIGILFIWAFKN